MKAKTAFFISLLIISITSQICYAVGVTLLVDKRGFPIKKECFVTIDISDAKGQQKPSNQDIYSGENLFFLINSTGEWQLDDRFLTEVLPSITFVQGSQVYRISNFNTKPFYEGTKIIKVLVSIPKDLDTTQPFMVKINRGDIDRSVQFQLSEELWPDYPKFKTTLEEAKSEFRSGFSVDAFRELSNSLKSTQLQKYTFYQEIKDLRDEVYSNYLQDLLVEFVKIRSDSSINDEAKLVSLNKLTQNFTVLFDSMTFDTVTVLPELEKLQQTRRDALNNYNTLLDFIKQFQDDLDNSKVNWMKSASLEDYRYKIMIESLYAFMRSQNINSPWNSNPTLPDSVKTKLTTFQLNDAFDALMRIINRNFAQRQSLIPTAIASNMRFYTSLMRQPYISVIMMVANFYHDELDSAKKMLELSLKSSSDISLNDWLADIRNNLRIAKMNIPGEVKKLTNDGMALAMQGNFEGARQKFQTAEVMAPTSAIVSYHFGIYYLLQRDTLRAITYFERCLKQDSTIVVAYRRLYNLFIIQNDWDNAIRVLENARRAENTWEFNFYLAHCLMLEGNYSEAILALDSAIALNPFNYYQFIFQGDAYLNNGDRVKAKELYERARDLDPNLNDAFDRLKNLH